MADLLAAALALQFGRANGCAGMGLLLSVVWVEGDLEALYVTTVVVGMAYEMGDDIVVEGEQATLVEGDQQAEEIMTHGVIGDHRRKNST